MKDIAIHLSEVKGADELDSIALEQLKMILEMLTSFYDGEVDNHGDE